MQEYGLQLYSVRDNMKENVAATIQEVAEMGYSFVETAGFFGYTAEDFAALLKKNGLRLSGTHSSWTDLRDKYEETLAYHKAIGNPKYIIPGADLSTKAKLDEFIDFVNEVQPKLAKEGIELQYHNHSHEFLPNEDGLLIHEELQKRTKLNFEIDTYWVYRANEDPIAILEKLEDRINVIHLKDGTMEEGKSLGLGTAPVKKVIETAKKLGFEMVVESEDQNPTGPAEVKRCIEFLKIEG